MQVTTIGLDIAKSSFQIHGADACGKVVLRKLTVIDRPIGSSAPAAGNAGVLRQKAAILAWYRDCSAGFAE